MNKYHRKSADIELLHEVIRCMKALMNNKVWNKEWKI